MSILSTIIHYKQYIKQSTGFAKISHWGVIDDIYNSDGSVPFITNLSNVETTLTTSKAYAVNDFFVYNGLIYRVTTAITNGGTINISPTSGYNVIQDNIGNEITALKNNVNIKVNSYDATNKILYLVSVI